MADKHLDEIERVRHILSLQRVSACVPGALMPDQVTLVDDSRRRFLRRSRNASAVGPRRSQSFSRSSVAEPMFLTALI
jgi:hypothetical protein